MVSFISKFLFTATVTAPTFLSLGLIGVIKDSTNYFQLWDDMLENKIFPTSFEWWGINISFGFMLICLIGIKIFLYRKSNKHKEGKTIQVKSYSNLSLNSAEQIISSIIPWLTIFADKLDFMVLFVCIILQCCFIAIASYNNNNYNLLCSIWSHIHAHLPIQGNTEIVHCLFKLQPSTTHIRKYISANFYLYGFLEHGSCFIFLLSVYINITGHDICFCFFSGRCKCTLHHQKIQSFFHCCSSYSSIASRISGTDRPIFARRLRISPCSTKRFQTAIGSTLTSGWQASI